MAWSPLAIARVEVIAQTIALDRPKAAHTWVKELFEAVSTLSRFPEKGRIVPEVGRPEIREVIYRGHRVIYRVGPRSIGILTVRHGRRLFDPGEISTD